MRAADRGQGEDLSWEDQVRMLDLGAVGVHDLLDVVDNDRHLPTSAGLSQALTGKGPQGVAALDSNLGRVKKRQRHQSVFWHQGADRQGELHPRLQRPGCTNMTIQLEEIGATGTVPQHQFSDRPQRLPF